MPDDTHDKAGTHWMIATRGNPMHTLGDHGLPFEVIGPDMEDGGPTMVAACPTHEEAERVLRACRAEGRT